MTIKVIAESRKTGLRASDQQLPTCPWMIDVPPEVAKQ
jgi:hypothetical protein